MKFTKHADPAIKIESLGFLDPKPDITPVESLRLSLLFVIVGSPGVYGFDAPGYVKIYGLERHFRPDDDKPGAS